jgi:DNA gyrase/topoisomerase IV subunit B
VSKAAGRAGRLALAYSSGDREVLREAGLNYDELRALGDPIAIGIKIVEAAFESQADSTVADAEERDIVAGVVEWILEQPGEHPPTPEEVVRKSIETTIAETALTEVSATVYAKAASADKRRSLERQIRDVAAEYAAQATLSPTGATEQEMSRAIEGGIRDIGKIFGVKS